MARKRFSPSQARPSWRRAKVFVVLNMVLWGAIGGWYFFQPPARRAEVSRLVGNWAESRKNITAFEVAWDLWQLYGRTDFVAGVAAGDRTHVYAGAPRSEASESAGAALRVLANTGYVVGYSEALGVPRWAAYRVSDVGVRSAPTRPEEFRVDARTAARVEPSDYARSGYDRGHLAPNHAIATRYGKQAQEETFLMSNICPQKHALNAGPWRELEQRIASNYAGRFGEVWVIAGPIFGEKPERLKRRVAVPEAFFMIVVDESDGQVRAQGFVFPQEAGEGAALERHLVAVDEIERRTGLDFFVELPDEAESALESRKAARVW